MKTLFSSFILLVAWLLAGSATVLGQCTYTTLADGLFSNVNNYTRVGTSCPSAPTLPGALDHVIIKNHIVLDRNFTIASTTNKKTFGSLTITAAGSLMEDATSRTLIIDHGVLSVEATINRNEPRLRVSVLEITGTEQGNTETMASIGANSAVQVTCLMMGNQGGVVLSDNALLNVSANVDVATGNGSIEGKTVMSSQPAGVRIRGIFTGTPGGIKKIFSGNLNWCMEGILDLGNCPIDKNHKKLTAPEGGDPTCRDVLPVTLVSFAAQAHPSGVKLNWATATELNNDYFEVQRSPDGQAFAPIGRVAGVGTSSTGATYSFTDTAPLAGPGYYRLRQTDLDGSTAFSAVVIATTQLKLEAALIYPNPGASTITLPTGAADAIDYRIYTATGRTVLADRTDGGTSVNVQQLLPGLYLLELIADGQRYVQRFVRH